MVVAPVTVFANTFIVSSNADNGVGTLREAIQNAANNGTLLKDSIIFNFSDTSILGRTIDLKTELPFLTSNLVIDGTSQLGSPIGVSNARVILQMSSTPTKFNFLYFEYANNIEIYGIFFFQTGFLSVFFNYNTQAINFRKSSHITIGKPDKGNYFIGLSKCISDWGFSVPSNYNHSDTCRDIVIQSNIFGLDLKGFISQTLVNGYNWVQPSTAINFYYSKDVLIGGATFKEANFIRSRNTISLQNPSHKGKGFYKIINNRICTFIDGTVDTYGSSAALEGLVKIGRYDNSNGLVGDSIDLELKFNHIVGAIEVSDICKDFKIQSNKIYSASYFLSTITGTLIWANANNNKIEIGGDKPEEGNEIYAQYYNGTLPLTTLVGQTAIHSSESYPNGAVEIKNNKIYCNQLWGSSVANGNSLPYSYNTNATEPWVIIDSTSNGYVAGRASKNARVDIYQDDECRACEGKLFIGSTVASSDGKWVYLGNFSGVVVTTATNLKGHTFAFSSPTVIDDSIKIIYPRCNSNNGSIKGLKILSSDNLEWRYSADREFSNSVLYSTKLDIDSLKPGCYWIYGKLGNTCYGWYRQYILLNYSAKISEKYVQKINPSCGRFNGSITNISVDSAIYCRFEWRNINGLVVGDKKDLLNVGDGSYRFYVIDTTKAGCIDSSSLFVLTNQSGPSLNLNSINIQHASCNKPNGAITNIFAQNAIGNTSVKWEDSTGKIVSNSFNLVNVVAGKYRLKFKDGSTCDTIITGYFSVLNNGLIIIDTTNKAIKSASCRVADGNITRLVVSGAQSFQWFNVLSNAVVSNSLDLLNVAAGSYQLVTNNAFGCETKGTIMVVPQALFQTIGVTSIVTQDASCNLANGQIQSLKFNRDTSFYTFKWVDSLSNSVLSNYTKLSQVDAGIYYLNATDTNGCEQKIYTVILKQLGKPSINTSGIRVTNDVCNLGNGSIDNIVISGGILPYTFEWAYNNGTTISTSPYLLKNCVQGSYNFIVKDSTGCLVKSNDILVKNDLITLNSPVIDNQNIFRNSKAIFSVQNAQKGTYFLYDTVPVNLNVDSSTNGILKTNNVAYDKYFYVLFKQGSCISSLSKILVTVFDESIIYLPNSFSPNADNTNDLLKIKIQGIVNNFKWQIYDRGGQKIFETSDYTKPWDGNYANKPLPIGTYYWIITATDRNKLPIKMSGSVTIFR